MHHKMIIGISAAAILSGCVNSTQAVSQPPSPVVAVALSAFPGAGSGTPPSASDLNVLAPQADALNDAVTDGTIFAPTVAPTGSVTFNGVVAFESGELGPPIGGQPPAERFIVGNLTMVADIGNGTATASATDFAEFVVVSPNVVAASNTIWGGFTGSLSGTGTATLSTINSSLDGTLVSGNRGSLNITSTLSGNIYDDNGTLVINGTTVSGDPNDFFIASE